MDETIDLRPYVEALVRHIWLIVGTIILAIMLSILLYLSSNSYEATTLVTIPDPTQKLQFDSRIESTLVTSQLLAAYPELAMSDNVIGLVLMRWQSLNGSVEMSANKLREMLEVSIAGDPRLLRLTVSNDDPKMAADLANIWAEEFVVVVEEVLGSGGPEFFINQLNETSTELQVAEDALVAFQTTNRQGIVDNELASLLELQRAYLTEERTLTQVLDDIQGLRTQLESNTTDVVSLAEQITVLTVQLRAYESIPQSVLMSSTPGVMQASAPAPQWQLNIGADTQLTTGDRAQQLQMLDALRRSVEASLANLETQRVVLEEPIFILQTEKQRLFNEGERLISDRDIAQETYATVARKVDEERIGSGETIANVASRATTSEFPERPNLPILLLLLSIAAALTSAAVIIALTWWRRVRAA